VRERVVRRQVFRGGGRRGAGGGVGIHGCDGRGGRRGSVVDVGLTFGQPRADGGRGGEALDEPAGPEGVGATAAAGLECVRAVVGAEGPAGVGGDEPLLKVPEEPAGDAAEDGAEGAGRTSPARVGEVRRFHLPVDDVAAAGAEGAEGQPHRLIGGESPPGGRRPGRAAGVGEGDEHPGHRAKHRTGLEGDRGEAAPRRRAGGIASPGDRVNGREIARWDNGPGRHGNLSDVPALSQ
jgi:hypothetical protein